MNKILLPNGLQVSSVALGAMNFGTTTSRENAFSVLDAYLDMGAILSIPPIITPTGQAPATKVKQCWGNTLPSVSAGIGSCWLPRWDLIAMVKARD